MSLAPPVLTGGASPSGTATSGSSPLDPASPHGPQGCPNSVLRIIIENMLYPITIDVLHQVRLLHVYIGEFFSCSYQYSYVRYGVLD